MCPNMASTVTTAVSGNVHQNRRRKSSSSALSSTSRHRYLRFQRHATDRTGTRMLQANLRVHRARVDHPFGRLRPSPGSPASFSGLDGLGINSAARTGMYRTGSETNCCWQRPLQSTVWCR